MALPCSVRSIIRGEAKQDGTLGCLMTPCTVQAVTDGSMEAAVRMRFGGFVFPNDPASVQVTHRGMIRETVAADGTARTERVGVYKRRVTGKGCFTGESAMEQYRALEELFGESGTLFLPGRVQMCIRDRAAGRFMPSLRRRRIWCAVRKQRASSLRWTAASERRSAWAAR